MLQYSQFDECIDFLTTPIEQFWNTGPNRKALLGSAEVIIENYIKFFTKELEAAILSKTTPDQKADLIRLYVSRLMKSINHRSVKNLQADSNAIIPYSNEMPPFFIRIGNALVVNNSEDPSDDLRYLRGCNILYHLIFDELQKCCRIFRIPFLELCEELNFDIETINVEYSIKNGRKEISPEIENSKEVNIQPKIKVPSDLDIKRELQQIMISENQFWRGLPMEFVVNHFSVFTSKKSRNENVFLTNEQFISFLKRGFLKDPTQPVQTINCSSREKGMIIKTFYQFYDVAVGQYACPHTKVYFIDLFTDCFNNWDPSTVKDFFRPGKVNKQL